MKTLILSFILVLLVQPVSAFADENSDLHIAAHVGASYAVETVSYLFFHKTLKLDESPSLILSGALTLGLGYFYKSRQSSDSSEIKDKMILNGIGTGAAMVTIKVFDL